MCNSESDFATIFVPPSVKTGLGVSFSASLDTSKAALKKVSGPYFRFYEDKRTELVSANDETLHPGHFLDSTVQLVLTDPTYSARRKKHVNLSAHEELLASDVQETRRSTTYVLRRVVMQLCSALPSSLRYGTRFLLQFHPRSTTA